MRETNVVCGVKACRYYSVNGCNKKVVVLNLKGQCLSLEELTAAEQAAADAAQNAAQKVLKDAAEGVLEYGA